MENNNSSTGTAGNGTAIAGGNTSSTDNRAVNALTGAIREALPGSSASPGGAGRPAKVAVSFMSTDTDTEFVIDTARIVAGMTGNKAFPTPIPALADIIAARNAYTAAVTAAEDSRLARSLRKKTRAALVFLLRQLAHFVEDTSAGDRTVLMSSGFPLQRGRSPVGPLPAPSQVRLAKGKTTGTAIARCRLLPRARAYQWRIAPAATPTAFLPVLTTFAAHAEFEGLTPTTFYVVQVCAVGTAGAGDWSETAAALVL
jgi:hypothetical protein